MPPCWKITRPWTRSGRRRGCGRADSPRRQPGPAGRPGPSPAGGPFDLVIDLQGLLKSAVWVALARSPRKVGYDRTREWSYRVLSERVAPFDREAHAVRRYLNLAHYLGAPANPPRFRLGLGAGVDVPACCRTKPAAVWWSCTPGPAGPASCGPRRLGRTGGLAQPGARPQVAITGSAADQGLAADIVRLMPEPALNLTGRTSLAELAAVLRRARLAVTTDTGAMHLAAALGTRTVALFGPTAPWRTGPFGQGHQVVRLDLECSPCFKRRCPEPRCLTELSPETVQAACEKILSVRPIS